MSVHLARAELLLAQNRPKDAIAEARLALSQDPNDAEAHALLARGLIEQGELEPALSEARAALGMAPDNPYFHRICAFALHRLDRENDALAAVNEALRLSPDDEHNFALRASIHLARRDWNAALADAEAGLALDPENVHCANLRASALVNLGRKSEAMRTVDFALEREPDNALSHANQGWNCLHANEPRRAQEFFREALRLEPGMEYARQGMLEALKAQNPVYRGILAYYLWMGRQSSKLQVVFIIATLVCGQLLARTANSTPQLGWVLWPLFGVFIGFIYLSWTARPMFNLLLRLHRFGRHVLSSRERRDSSWFAGSLGAIAGAATWWALGGGAMALLTLVVTAMLSVCVAATVTRERRARVIQAWATVAFAALSAVTLIQIFRTGDAAAMRTIGFAFLGVQLLANVVRD